MKDRVNRNKVQSEEGLMKDGKCQMEDGNKKSNLK